MRSRFAVTSQLLCEVWHPKRTIHRWLDGIAGSFPVLKNLNLSFRDHRLIPSINIAIKYQSSSQCQRHQRIFPRTITLRLLRNRSRMNTSQQDQQTQPSTPAQDNSPMMKRTISSEEIMAGEKEIWIQHGDSIYRLCETKSGKLILQK